MEEEVVAVLGLVLTIAHVTMVHVRMLGHFIRPHVFKVGGDQVGKEVVFALPAFATKSTLDEGLIATRKSSWDKAKAGQFQAIVAACLLHCYCLIIDASLIIHIILGVACSIADQCIASGSWGVDIGILTRTHGPHTPNQSHPQL